ncbi:MAG: DUF4388 domain-containing protein [Myxococcales bacterium]|nr:DUF4388 domain-containing protein [Myxococcales bacterium]
MSLVGSLEDLSLGDILQIVSLSLKSGLLLLRSDEGDGRIVFRDGLVRAAYVKGEPEDLRGLLVPGGFAEPDQVDEALELSRESGVSLDEAIAERAGIPAERLDSLRREHVERSVIAMFSWRAGEFSFEVHSEIEDRDVELALPFGINAQYLSMEAARLGDEGGEDSMEPSFSGDDSDAPMFSGEDGPGVAAPAAPTEDDEATGEYALVSPLADVDLEADENSDEDARDALALATVARADEEASEVAAFIDDEDDAQVPSGDPLAAAEAFEEPASTVQLPVIAESAEVTDAAISIAKPLDPVAVAIEAPPAPTGCLVVLDPDLRVLEWLKSTLHGIFERIHIFQNSDAAMGRIRQYLARGIVPTALISSEVEPDRFDSTRNIAELLRRLRTQAPRMPLLVIHEGAGDPPTGVDAADAVMRRPSRAALSDRRKQAEVAASVEQLRRELRGWAGGTGDAPSGKSRTQSTQPAPIGQELQRLKQVSRRLRDPANRGDVLNVVLDFAAETFGRVAMFMVRDDLAVGIAQRRLPEAGGPDDEDFRELRIAVAEPAWFRKVFETGEAHCAVPSGSGDAHLVELLGGQAPERAYVAPIESGGRLAALLYADNLPGNTPMGDATGLDIVIHEAGLALDRAFLERALAEGGGAGDPVV